MYRHNIKRLLDLALSVPAFFVLLPVFIIITVVFWILNHGRPFFFQLRPGRNEKIFRVIKFKTMNDSRDEHGNLLPDEKRITGFGRFVRKTSLDEIPQLLNVIKGDMSLVGPRPLLVSYLPLYTEEQKRRHKVRPGITGWAQVNGRNAISWEKKFELDIWYIDHISFQTDWKIILLTIKKVIKPEGISQDGHATMPYFEGAKK